MALGAVRFGKVLQSISDSTQSQSAKIELLFILKHSFERPAFIKSSSKSVNVYACQF